MTGVVDAGLSSRELGPLSHSVVEGAADTRVTTYAVVRGLRPDHVSRKTKARTAGDHRSKARRLDQFYTRRQVAAHSYGVFRRYFVPEEFLMIEPSAGSGSFFALLPDVKLGLDVDPHCGGLLKADLLEGDILSDRRQAYIGNPPFGTNCDMARRFFNHAARRADVIAFILPATFRKGSIQNSLDPAFHLIHDEDVPRDGFLFEGRPYDVRAVFQIWERRSEPRDLWPTETSHPDFEFLPDRHGADLVIQRVGAAAGQVHVRFGVSPKSHLFVRVVRGDVEAVMRRLDLRTVAANVAACPSIAKSEIVELYRRATERDRDC